MEIVDLFRFELSKNSEYLGREKTSKEEKRENNEKKSKTKKNKEEKLLYDDRKVNTNLTTLLKHPFLILVSKQIFV